MKHIKDAYYFPHDSNAKDDPKCVLLIEQLGLEGYGIFWVLIETLREQPNFSYPLKLVSALARRYNTTSDKGLKHPILCYGKGKQKGYLEKDEITKNTEWIDKWKVFTPRANNIGTELNDDNLNSFVGKPNTICTESYMVVGVDFNLDNQSAKNICKYFTTKFARFQHRIGKASQDGTAKTYKFVPLQDFTSSSDIDWTKSVEDIDKQLYKKYKLSDEDIAFIDEMIKPMN